LVPKPRGAEGRMLLLGFEQSTGLALSKVEAWGRMSSR